MIVCAIMLTQKICNKTELYVFVLQQWHPSRRHIRVPPWQWTTSWTIWFSLIETAFILLSDNWHITENLSLFSLHTTPPSGQSQCLKIESSQDLMDFFMVAKKMMHQLPIMVCRFLLTQMYLFVVILYVWNKFKNTKFKVLLHMWPWPTQ